MAFDFFRRRQKMVIIIMVVLMVSFLVSFQGVQWFFEKDRNKMARGHTPNGDIRFLDVQQAEFDLEILGRYLGLAARPTEAAIPFLQLETIGSNANVAFVLLQREAARTGISVADAEVDVFLREIGMDGAQLKGLLDSLRASDRAVNLKDIRAAVAHWLLVQKAFMACLVTTPPSDQELKHLYRDLREAIQIQVVRVPADKFIDKLPEPTADEIRQQFEAFRTADSDPRTYPTADSFGFGYRQPNRVKIDYLLVDSEALRRAIQPGDEEILNYFETHRDKYTREVPLATQPTTEPTTEPAKTRTVRKTLRDAEPDVVRDVTEESVRAMTEAILAGAEQALAKLASGAEVMTKSPYETVVDEKTSGPASPAVRNALTVELDPASAAKIQNMPLEKAIAELARLAKLKAIVYPWGPRGEYNVNPQIPVTLKVTPKMTLGQALDQITESVFGPTTPATQPASRPASQPATQKSESVHLQWAIFPPLRTSGKDVLFPVAPSALSIFPLTVHQTGMLDHRTLMQNDVLGFATTSIQMFGGQRVADQAFQAADFQKPGEKGIFLKLKEDKRAYVFGRTSGAILWRLVEAKPAFSPDTIEQVPGLRDQVIHDLKIKKGFEQAKKVAQEIVDAKTPLEQAAKTRDLSTFQTELFTRKQLTSPLRQRQQMAMYLGQRLGPELYLTKPYDFVYSQVPNITLPTDAVRAKFMEEAFTLAPKNIEPPYPKTGPEETISLPPDQAVLVAQRIGYRPPTTPEFEDEYRPMLAMEALQVRNWTIRTQWFDWDNIAKRTGYTEAKGE